MVAELPVAAGPLASQEEAEAASETSSAGGVLLGFGAYGEAPISSHEESEAAEESPTLTASPGTVDVAGAAANLRRDYTLTASPGVVECVGSSISPTRGRHLTASPGTVEVAGSGATLTYTPSSLILLAEPGTVEVVGASATLIYTPESAVLNAEPGVIEVLGASLSPVHNRGILAEPAIIEVAGADAFLARDRTLTAEPGTVEVQGSGVTFLRGYAIVVVGGQLVLVGSSVTLVGPVAPIDALFTINGVPYAVLAPWEDELAQHENHVVGGDGKTHATVNQRGAASSAAPARNSVFPVKFKRLAWADAQNLLDTHLLPGGQVTLGGILIGDPITAVLVDFPEVTLVGGEGHFVKVACGFQKVRSA